MDPDQILTTLKLLIIGESGVGKSSLLLRFTDDAFDPEQAATIGVDFKVKTITINGDKIKLAIWDTAGQERFRTLTPSYYRGGQGAILVYDVTSRESFQKVDNWLNELETYSTNHDLIKMLVGNKCDMLDEKVVSTEEGEKLAKEFGIQFWECSAKNDINVDESFIGIARGVKDRLVADGQGGPAQKPAGVALGGQAPATGNKKCC